jgi:hypothetical protein
MKPLPPPMERLIAAGLLAAAFVVMASIFDPGATRAGSSQPPTGPAQRPTPAPLRTAPAATADAHANLIPFGELATTWHRLSIFSTDDGTRYSVYDLASGAELATLITAEQVEQRFGISMTGLDFSAGTLMSGPDAAWDDFP